MPDDLIENNYSKLSLPVGRVKTSKFLYIILIILGVLVLIVGGLNLYLKNNSKKITENKIISNKVINNEALNEPGGAAITTSQDAVKISKKTLDWINSQRNEDGVYSVGCECSDQACRECADKIYIPRNIAFVLWGKFKYSEHENNYQDLINEISLFQNNLKEYSLQYGGWNCKLLYDIWKSDKLSQNTKDQINNICVKSEYEFEDNLKISNDFDSVILDEIDRFLKKQLVINNDKEYNPENLYKYSGLVSEMVTRLLWKPISPAYTFEGLSETQLAKIYFEKALLSYKAKTELTMKDDAMLGIAAVDMYRLTNNNSYLDLAKYLFNLKSEAGNTNSYNLVFYGILGQELQSVAKNDQYEISVRLIVDKIIENGYNRKDDKADAFKGPGFFYNIVENSLIVGLLPIL